MTRQNEFRNDIQVLRGIALLSVVCFHAFEGVFPNGYLGVDVFFLISGFVITPQIIDVFAGNSGRAGRLKIFYIRRFYRLIPALGAMVGFSALIIFLLGSPEDHERFARQGISTLLFGGNVGAYLFSQDYFSPNPNPLVHTWSLAVEQQFYIFLPLILCPFLLKKTEVNFRLLAGISLISLPSFVSFLFPVLLEPLYSRIGINLASQFSFYSTIDRVWQFALGSLAFLFLRTKRTLNLRLARIVCISSALLMVVFLFGQLSFAQKTGSVFISMFTLIAIVYRSFDFLPGSLKLMMEWVGNRSYSLYLIHMPLLYLVKYSPTPVFRTGTSQVVATVGAVLATFVLGAMSFAKIESRFRKSWTINSGISQSMLRVSFVSLLLPGCLFLLMDLGSRNNYWGLENDLGAPVAAWELDAGCGHFGELSEPCLVSKAGNQATMLLIGDSHATHLYPPLFESAYRNKLDAAIWTKGSCRVQFEQSNKKALTDECIEQNKNILIWVKENKPSVIVVSQYVMAESSQIDLRNALTLLKSFTPNVLLIENTPVFPDESRYMVRLPLVYPRYEPPKTFPRSKMLLKDVSASAELGKWARRNQIDTMDLSPLFCSRSFCNRYSEDGWLYSDEDHLSLVGAKLAEKQFDDYFQDVFRD
jgi:peptidoglycan/LPS O-acetylase OafA/YrhL